MCECLQVMWATVIPCENTEIFFFFFKSGEGERNSNAFCPAPKILMYMNPLEAWRTDQGWRDFASVQFPSDSGRLLCNGCWNTSF